MRGLTPEEYCNILKFVQKHHYFAKYDSEELREAEKKEFPNIDQFGFNIKYVDSCYDSRFGDIWMVKFRGMGNNLAFATNHFNSFNPQPKGWRYDNLYDWIMGYLRGDWKNKKILKTLIYE